jgi:hypothetical protein
MKAQSADPWICITYLKTVVQRLPFFGCNWSSKAAYQVGTTSKISCVSEIELILQRVENQYKSIYSSDMKRFRFQLVKLATVVTLILSSTSGYSQYKLTKSGEFKINTLLRLDLVDYSPKTQLYLGVVTSSKGERIVLVDKKGEIVVDKSLKGEGPNHYVSNLNSLGFSEEGDVWLQTVTHLLLYDQALNLKKRISYSSSVQHQIFGRKDTFLPFYKSDPKSGLSFTTNPTNTNSFIPNAKTNSELIEIYNSAEERSHRIAPVSDRSIHKKLAPDMLSSLYFIVYTIDRVNNKLLLTTRLDGEITRYDLRTGQLESRVKINHGEFNLLKLNSISVRDLSSSKGESLGPRNHNLFVLNGNLSVLNYIKEIPAGVYEKKKAGDRSYVHMYDPDYHRLIIFDGSKQVSEDVMLPKHGQLMLALPGNQLLFKITDPDVEEDFVRYAIYSVEKE